MHSRITGTGSYLPERVVHNTDLEKMMDTSDSWIRERTGIVQRHYAADNETTVDLAEQAARRALQAAGLQPGDIDLIVFGTTTPDLVFPNAGAMLQARLGCTGGPAFSVEAACSSFIFALSVAEKFIRLGEARRALVVGSETLTRIIDFTDRTTAVLFADGAGAVILEASETPGVISTHLHTDATYQHLLYCTGGISKGYEPGTGNRAVIRMAGRELFKIAVTMLGNSVDEVLAKNQLEKSQIDWLVPHQANIRIIQAVARKLDLPMERVIVTVQDHGNTSAASVPLALDAGVRDGRIKPGDLILLEAFGAGLTWGAALIRM
jgi:3-oxoacyl-[acyl-carrier-protein] synthase III